MNDLIIQADSLKDIAAAIDLFDMLLESAQDEGDEDYAVTVNYKGKAVSLAYFEALGYLVNNVEIEAQCLRGALIRAIATA